MSDPAGLLVGWARLDTAQGEAETRLAMGEARVPADASQRITENALKVAIGKWLRWQSGRGWKLVSDVHVGKPRPTFDAKAGRPMPGMTSYPLTGTFAFKGVNRAVN